VHLSTEVNGLGLDHKTVESKVPAIGLLTEKWNQFLVDVQARGQALSHELARQQANEALRLQFADHAKNFNSLLFEEKSAINAHVAGDLEEQLANVQKHKPIIIAGQAQLNELENLSHKLQDAQVFHNPHTEHNFPTLKTNYDQLVRETNSKEALLQKEIIQKTNSLVSPQQLAEFKEVFQHFDKDKNNTLSRLEFKSCLQSLGDDPDEKTLDQLMANMATDGRIDFESFVTFMSNKAADSDTQSQILEAFRVISGDKDFVTEEQLRRALPAEKVNYLITKMPHYKGQAGDYDYQAWAQSAFH